MTKMTSQRRGRSRRRLLATAASTLSGLVAAACGPLRPAAPPSDKTAEAPTQIELWARSPSDADVFARIKPLFEQRHPGLTLKIETPAGIYEKLVVVLAGGGAPDTSVINTPWGVPMMSKGHWLNLERFLKADREMQTTLKDFAPPALQAYRFKGDLHAVPLTSETIVLWYNQDLVQRAGLVPPAEIENDPQRWNWQTAADYAQRLNRGRGSERDAFGVNLAGTRGDYGLQPGWGNLVYSNGGRIVNEAGTRWVLSGAENREPVQFCADLIWKRDVSPQFPFSDQQLFLEGRLAMLAQGEFFRRNVFGPRAPAGGLLFQWNLAQLPFSPRTRKRACVYHSLALPIVQSSKAPEAVWQFLRVTASREAQQFVTDLWGSRGANTKTHDPWVKSNAGGGPPANWAAIVKADAYGVPFPVSPYVESAQLLEPTTRIMYGEILANKIGVEAGLREIDRETNARLEQAAPASTRR